MPVQEGKPAPAFDLESTDGRSIALKDLKGKKVVLYFYPKDDTSGCTTEACNFRDHYAKFNDAVVLGVSPDNLKSHDKFKTKYNRLFRCWQIRSMRWLISMGCGRKNRCTAENTWELNVRRLLSMAPARLPKYFPRSK